MATATFDRLTTALRTGLRAAGPVLAALGLAACGGSASRSPGTDQAGASPAAVTRVRISDGATLSYPAGWRRIKSDPGTASVAHFGPRGSFLGYLNITPRQSTETLGDWPRFRIDHNAEEGDRGLTTLSVRRDVPFAGARGTCLTDRYTTRTDNRYVEMACLVVGHRGSVVVVGAAPPSHWRRMRPALQRAIQSLKL